MLYIMNFLLFQPHDKLVELRRIVAEAGSLLSWNDKHMNWRDRKKGGQLSAVHEALPTAVR